ncbi:MAG: hypothetical protein NVS2B8_20540 [Vulcanimicrobiaceae bacterium]
MSSALAIPPALVGQMARQLAANRRVPMVVVECAHLMHDLSIAVAEANHVFFDVALFPYRLLTRIVEARRSP